MTGTETAALMRRTCSRYFSGPRRNSSAFGKKEMASALALEDSSMSMIMPCSSRVICSSKSECMTMAETPASSRRFTMPMSSTMGEAPAIRGWSSSRPR